MYSFIDKHGWSRSVQAKVIYVPPLFYATYNLVLRAFSLKNGKRKSPGDEVVPLNDCSIVSSSCTAVEL